LSVIGFGLITYDGVVLIAAITVAEAAPVGIRGCDPKYCRAETGKIIAKKPMEIGAGFIRDHVSKS